jgi:hypothetical protein
VWGATHDSSIIGSICANASHLLGSSPGDSNRSYHFRYGVSSGIISGVISGVISDVISGVISGVISAVISAVLSGIISGVLSGSGFTTGSVSGPAGTTSISGSDIASNFDNDSASGGSG